MRIGCGDSVSAAALANYTVNPRGPVSGYTHDDTLPQQQCLKEDYEKMKEVLEEN